MRLIPLSDGEYVYVDAADHEWHLMNGYPARTVNGVMVLMHREIMCPPKGMAVDHADGSRLNNCRSNLRVCTRAENQRNTRGKTGSVSVYKGVSYDKREQKWKVQCRCEGRNQKVRHFDDEIEAARAYDRTAVEHFGEFARLNFPREWPPERRQEASARHKPQQEGEKDAVES